MTEEPPTDRRQRVDKWLWFARVVKTRTLAQKLVHSGAVRIQSQRVTQPGHKISPDTVLTISINDGLRILRVLDPGTRRGPAPEAMLLYEDLTPELPKRDWKLRPGPVAPRAEGAGRPTKKQRRQTDHFNRGEQAD